MKKNRAYINRMTCLCLLFSFLAGMSGCFHTGAQESGKRTLSPSADLAMELLAQVEVGEIDLELNDPNKKVEQVLWDTFANKPFERKFSSITAEPVIWQKNYALYRDEILRKAGIKGFDIWGLKQCLEKVAPDMEGSLAILPIAVYGARMGNTPVWIIVCKWEFASDFVLGHIRVWALNKNDCRQVGFVTCE